MDSQQAARSSQQNGGGTASRELPPASPHEPNWPLLYSLVIGELVVTIALFYAFTKVFE